MYTTKEDCIQREIPFHSKFVHTEKLLLKLHDNHIIVIYVSEIILDIIHTACYYFHNMYF